MSDEAAWKNPHLEVLPEDITAAEQAEWALSSYTETDTAEDEKRVTAENILVLSRLHAAGRESLRSRLAEVERENENMRAFLKSEHQDRWDSLLILNGAEKPEHYSEQECPTFYDGCHCSVEVLSHNIKRAEAAEAKVATLQRESDAILRFLRHQSAMKLPGEHDVVRSLALQKAADQIEAGYHLDDCTAKSAALSK